MKRKIAAALAACWLLCGGVASAQEAGEYRNALKLTFLSWGSGSTKLSYERALTDGQTGEICVGLIGAGFDKYRNRPVGLTVRYGHKFFVGEALHTAPLEGFYLRPELVYSRYDYDSATTGERTKANMVALLGTFGYQKVWGRWLADLWVGAGPAVGEKADTGYHHGFQLWDYFGSQNDNLALSFSIRVGWCF